MSELQALGFAIDLAFKAGREGGDLSAERVLKIVETAKLLAAGDHQTPNWQQERDLMQILRGTIRSIEDIGRASSLSIRDLMPIVRRCMAPGWIITTGVAPDLLYHLSEGGLDRLRELEAKSRPERPALRGTELGD